MAIDPNAVGSAGDPAERSWGYRDSLLYAVGIGAGAEDPVGGELEFTTNNSKGIEQQTFPTQTAKSLPIQKTLTCVFKMFCSILLQTRLAILMIWSN